MLNNTQILLDLNIIDFSIIREFCLYLDLNDDKQMFQIVVNHLYYVFKAKLKIFENEINYNNFSVLSVYSNFFMILLLNLQEKKTFIQLVFGKESKLMKVLVKVVMSSRLYQNSNKICKILCNLFLDEYKEIYFIHDDPNIENMFIINNEKFSKINHEGLDIYPKKIYKVILDNILNFKLTYDLIFKKVLKNSQNKEKDTPKRKFVLYEDSDKPVVKLQIIQSIVRIVFSKEKYNYYTEEEDNMNYEYNFMVYTVEKSVEYTRSKYGDNYSCLFRKEEIFDEIIKYFFFIFGNSLLVKSFVDPIKKLLPIFENNEVISLEDFMIFFDDVILTISNYMPSILKILLKLVHKKVNEHFTIDATNYSPMLTLLFFNFFISPRVQEIHNISPSKYPLIRNINRIIRNICYNTKFEENDDISSFNDIIVRCNYKLRLLMEDILVMYEGDLQSLSRSLKDFTTDKYIIYPKYLFYIDCSFFAYILKVGDNSLNTSEMIKKESNGVNGSCDEL